MSKNESSYDQICWLYEKRGNLSTYVCLPMLKIYVGRFIDNLHDVYLGDNNELYMHLKEEFTEQFIFDSPYYQSDYTLSTGHLIIFLIPDEFNADLEHFRKGRYSKFSKLLLQNIIKFSSLDSNNRLLLAITNDDDFRDIIEKVLDCKLSRKSELLDKPSKRNFAKFNDFFKDELEDERQNS